MRNKTIRAKCHERLADVLRAVFQSLPAGSRLDSIETLAARYEVSAATIRLALVLLQNEGLVTLRHGSGCYVCKPTPQTPKRHIAILSELNLLRSPHSNAFYSHIMHELRVFLDAQGHSSRMYIGHIGAEPRDHQDLSCKEFMEDLALNRIGGVAALATLPLPSWTHQAALHKTPIVGMGGPHYNFNAAVDPDIPGAIHDALVQLIDNGRERPAFIGWTDGGFSHFKRIARALGLTPNPHWIRISLNPGDPGAGWSDFREIYASEAEKPDCIIFSDDVLFQDALPAILSANIQIPAELEVVVMANKGIPLPRPFPYTRMDCDPVEFARTIGTTLLECMAGKTPPLRTITIPYKTVTQDETKLEVEQVMD